MGDTIERMIGNLPARRPAEDDVVITGRVSTKGKWLLGATKIIISGSGIPVSISGFVKKVKNKKKAGKSQGKPTPVDRLRQDKQYLRRLAADLGREPDDPVSSAVSASASETIKFLSSRQRFWTQAASSQ